MLRATLIENKPSFSSKKKKEDYISISKSDYNRCKDIFTINRIDLALNELELKHKIINEVDIYNIIEYVLAANREK